MEIILIVTHLVAAAVGAWAYRYVLKRDPDTLEALARKARSLTD